MDFHLIINLGRYMEIRIRSVFRVLGIILCLCFIVALPLMFFGEHQAEKREAFFFLLCSIFFVPIVLSSCILGKVPEIFTKFLDDETIHDRNTSEKFFTEFNAKSIGFAVILLSIVASTIFISL